MGERVRVAVPAALHHRVRHVQRAQRAVVDPGAGAASERVMGRQRQQR